MNRLTIAAFHESGHAIAARLRGAEVIAVSIEPGFVTWQLPQVPQKLFRNGERIQNPEPVTLPVDDGFISYAGSWAEVRAQVTSSDRRFAELVAATLRRNTTDYADVLEAEPPDGIEAQWSANLEDHWPYIARVAKSLHREHITKTRSEREKRIRRVSRSIMPLPPRF